jgi:hypothetical protein
MSALLILAIAVTACGSGGDNEDAPSAIVPDTDTVTVSSEEEPASETPAVAVEDPEDQSDEEPAVVEEDEPPAMVIPPRPPADYDAAAATITIDGEVGDWATIAPLEIQLSAITDREGEVGDYDARLRVATDTINLYVLVEIDDDYDFNLDDHNLSPALAVMFPIDAAAGTAMGATEDDQETSLGLTDVWHWELDCGAGELSGLVSAAGGNDPACNLDDEWASAPEDREDDAGETSLIGVWQHTNPEPGADGTWIFEMARPLTTTDTEDAQFTAGSAIGMALAYWDPDETDEGWEDDGHAVSVSGERAFLSVSLPFEQETVGLVGPSIAEQSATATTISVDGAIDDWARVVPIEIELAPIADRVGEVGEYTARVRFTADADTLYVLVEVDDDYDFNLDDHNLSPALAVMFPIDAAAGTAMGATEDDQENSLGLTDVWHWELDCVAGAQSGLISEDGGNDPDCNLDDEWALAPEDRKDDAAETSLIGVWTHTNPVVGGDGTWIFEMARPLNTSDPEDAQFALGEEFQFAIAYWDPDETDEGWEDDGHAVNVSDERPFLSFTLPVVTVSARNRPVDDEQAVTARVAAPTSSGTVVTVDARNADGWTFFDFGLGQVVQASLESSDWQLAFQRTTLLTNSGATNRIGTSGALDLGAVDFDQAGIGGAGVFVVDGLNDSGEVLNPAISSWYNYRFIDHLIEAKPNVYAVRAGDDSIAFVRFDSYYCQDGSPGCVTFVYRLARP